MVVVEDVSELFKEMVIITLNLVSKSKKKIIYILFFIDGIIFYLHMV
jgi:hypothetical protein